MMKQLALTLITVSFAFAAPPATAGERAAANMVNTRGKIIGIAKFEQTPAGVLVSVYATGLPPGEHALHLHTVGACTPDFMASKGHINPDGRKHGMQNPAGPDNGDLPNIFASSNGTARVELFTPWVSISRSRVPLLDADGSALIIHELGDDHLSQPIGGAGGRIACGVITPK